jgi:CBS domain-containing protein
MALEQQAEFLQQIPPFGLIDVSALRQAALSMDVIYLPTGVSVPLLASVSADNQQAEYKTPTFLYFVIKGVIAEESQGLVVGRYSIRGYFGERNVIQMQSAAARLKPKGMAHADSVFRVLEEAILYRMPGAVFLELFQENEAFQEYFNANIVDKLNAMHHAVQTTTSTEVMMDTVCSAPIQPLVIVSDTETLQSAIQKMVEHKTDACVVAPHGAISMGNQSRGGQADEVGYGIITSTDILKLIADEQTGLLLQDLASSGVANGPLLTVHEFDYLFNALLKMTRFQVDRLIVRSDTDLVGFLNLKDLMSLFANQSGLALLKVEQAQSVDDLHIVAQQIDQLVENLNRKGIKTHYIAKLVNELHRKMIHKLVELLLPEALQSEVCLMVMGSEGRAEQVVRTDQDNALMFSNELSKKAQEQLMIFSDSFTQAMIEIGFPTCPGKIMLSNAMWRQSVSQFSEKVRHWFDHPTRENFMYIAILCDAEVVYGHSEWLFAVKRTLQQRMADNPIFLRHFAKAVIQFETPVSFFGGLRTENNSGLESIDLKKGGIFPIVHGVRCYALEYKIEPTNTHWRIKALIDLGLFEESFGIELGETLNFLNTLRLESMLKQINQLDSGVVNFSEVTGDVRVVPNNYIDVSGLSHLQQDLLKQSLNVVEAFKRRVTKHFKLHEML